MKTVESFQISIQKFIDWLKEESKENDIHQLIEELQEYLNDFEFSEVTNLKQTILEFKRTFAEHILHYDIEKSFRERALLFNAFFDEF